MLNVSFSAANEISQVCYALLFYSVQCRHRHHLIIQLLIQHVTGKCLQNLLS